MLEGCWAALPYVIWPAAAVIGIIGCKIEAQYRGEEGMNTPAKHQSVMDERTDRLLQENETKDPTDFQSLKDTKFGLKAIYEQSLESNLEQFERLNIIREKLSVPKDMFMIDGSRKLERVYKYPHFHIVKGMNCRSILDGIVANDKEHS